ncbi:MAG: NAD(P)H-hydrate dehydratase [Ignavibacteriaceae bacterium]
MIPLFSTAQVIDVDTYAINQLNMPSIMLMENAAINICKIARRKFQTLNHPINNIGFLCGKGNNGGDGFAAARHFANSGYRVTVLHTGDIDEMSPDAVTNFLILGKLAEQNKSITIKKYNGIKTLNALQNCEVIFDALLGSGAKGELKDPYKAIIQKTNRMDVFRIAIDIPTGLNADTGYGEDIFQTDLTITLGEFKRGLFYSDGYAYAGEVIKGNIGIGNSYFDNLDVSEYLVEPEDILSFIPQKKKNSHKYSAGKVFTIAGSGKLPGAAALTSKTVLKTGAGSSILAFPKSVRKLVHKNLLEVIVETYEDEKKECLSGTNLKEINKRIEWADVVAIGPGLGRAEHTQAAILQIIKKHRYKNIVIDADAVFALGDGKYKDLTLQNAVLTPHHAEFSNLLGVETGELKKDILSYGKKFVDETGSYLVLKGAPTIIFNPAGEVFINTTGNAGMAKFGTGDVLTGVLAGFMAQSKNLEEAVLCGVYLHSLTADLLLKDFTEYGYTAADLINKFPASIKFIRKSFA